MVNNLQKKKAPLALLNNRYRVLKTIGHGGFGDTFLAEDSHLPSCPKCVVKALRPQPDADMDLVRKFFEQEAIVLEQLGRQSDGIPELYAYFYQDDYYQRHYYLVQEYIEGVTIAQFVQNHGVFTEKQAIAILAELLKTVDFLHSKNIIHRDIKPDNIILRASDGKPVLIDYGAVKKVMASGVTNQTVVIGTEGYMPLEQSVGEPSYVSDIYALGMTAIFMLTGQQPQQIEDGWLKDAKVSEHTAEVISKAIQPAQCDRFHSPTDMAIALTTQPDSPPNNNPLPEILQRTIYFLLALVSLVTIVIFAAT